MDDLRVYFSQKRNLVNLLVLAVIALTLPLGVGLIKRQQVFLSRAREAVVEFQKTEENQPGCVKLRQGKLIAICADPIPIKLVSSFGGPGEVLPPEPTETPRATRSPRPTRTPRATRTPRPTDTPKPTKTPKPTASLLLQSIDQILAWVSRVEFGVASVQAGHLQNEQYFCEGTRRVLEYWNGEIWEHAFDRDCADTGETCDNGQCVSTGGGTCNTDYNQYVGRRECTGCKQSKEVWRNECGDTTYKNTNNNDLDCDQFCQPVGTGACNTRGSGVINCTGAQSDGGYPIGTPFPKSGQCKQKIYEYHSNLDPARDQFCCVAVTIDVDKSQCPTLATSSPRTTPRATRRRTSPPGNGHTNPPRTNPPRTNPPDNNPPPGVPKTVYFKIADSVEGLATASAQLYDREPKIHNFKFSDATPGKKTVYVVFVDERGSESDPKLAEITLVGPDPRITAKECRTSLGGDNVIVTLAGTNFGTDRGTVQAGSLAVRVEEGDWTNGSIRGLLERPSSSLQGTKRYKLTVTRPDGGKAETECEVGTLVQLSLGAKLFCRAPQASSVSNVEFVFAQSLTSRENLITEQATIDREGNVQGLKTKFETGKSYVATVKAPRSLRRQFQFTAGAGTNEIPDLFLPVGDIFPLNGGDGKINALDKAELTRQWGGGSGSRNGDFNSDTKVNSIDWACMRFDFSKEDAPGLK